MKPEYLPEVIRGQFLKSSNYFQGESEYRGWRKACGFWWEKTRQLMGGATLKGNGL
jgi:hypothetical protein